MAKAPIVEVENLQNESSALGAINSNFESLQDAVERSLTRGNESPTEADNAMHKTLDMNSQRIINLPAPLQDTEAARHGDIQTYVDQAEAIRDEVQELRDQTETFHDETEALSVDFKSVYLGSQPDDPTDDLNGGPLQSGAIYFNTSDSTWRIYHASVWNILPKGLMSTLLDVDIGARTTGDYLVYNSVSGKWELNKPDISDLTDVDTSGVANHDFLWWNNSNSQWEPRNITAADVDFDNSSTDLSSTNVQTAIAEISNRHPVLSFNTRALAAAATIDADVKTVTILGYTTAGDGGGAKYTRVAVQPSHTVKFQSADGGWWEIDENVIDVRMAGAIAADNTKAATNETAIEGALATGRPVYLPDGLNFYTQGITVPTNAHSFYGYGTLTAAGTYSSPDGVLMPTSTVDFAVRDITVDAVIATYTTLSGISGTGNTRLSISNVKVTTGYEGIKDVGSTHTRVINCSVPVYDFMGIHLKDSTNVLISGNYVSRASAAAHPSVAVKYGIWTEACSRVVICGNWSRFAGFFGIVASGDGVTFAQHHDVVCYGNRVEDSGRDGISMTNIKGFSVVGNVLEWNTTGSDFGISTWADPDWSGPTYAEVGAIVGNTIRNAPCAGIALCGNTRYVNVSGNTIYNANSENGSNDANLQGIFLFGGINQYNNVTGNNIIDPSGHLTWACREFDNAGAGGPPDYNSFSNNRGIGTSGQTKIIGVHSTIGVPEYFHRPGSTYTTTGNYPLQFELGDPATGSITPSIDFHSAGGGHDWDSRIIASGGSSGQDGLLSFLGASQLLRGTVAIGATNPGTRLTVSANASATGPAVQFQETLQICGDNAAQMGIVLDSFAGNAQIIGRRANNTMASPSQVLSTNPLLQFGGTGYDGSAYTTSFRAAIHFRASQDWTGSNQGAYMAFYTTADNANTAAAERMRLFSGGGLNLGGTTDPGSTNFKCMGALGSGAPTTKTGTSSTVGDAESSVIYNASGTHTTTLPAAATYPGRWLYVKTIANQAVNSASSNVCPLGSASAGTAILSGNAGRWAMLQSNGTNWIIMAGVV